MTAPSRRRVVVLLVDNAVCLDLAIPTHLFGVANSAGTQLYDVRTCTADGRDVRTDSGFAATVDHGPEVLEQADIVVIPGTALAGPREHGFLPRAIAAALARRRIGAQVVSLGTGSFVLAAAGLLDGRRATTDRMQCARFRELYPSVALDEQASFVDDGGLLTSSGPSAGIEMCLHVIRRDFGNHVVESVVRCSPMAALRSQDLPPLAVQEEDDGSTAATRTWMRQHLQDDHTLAALAAHAGLSVRTFTRHFRRETGQSPWSWLAAERIRRACALLRDTDLQVADIAREAGFGTPASLRQQLKAATGLPPMAYRLVSSRGDRTARG